MNTPRYETHKMPHPALPFIYHRRFEITSQEKVPNWHENIELLQATEGSGYVLCGPERLPLTPDTVVLINADTLHSIGTDTHLAYRCLIIDNSFFTANGVPIHSLSFQSLLTDPQVSGLMADIAQAYAQFTPEDPLCILSIRSPVQQLVLRLCRRYATQRLASPANAHVKNAMIYLRKHLADPLSLDTLAAAVGISKYHLARQFRLFTGSTVVQTLNRMRCAEARRLLEGGMSVSAAAASCGFDNLSYFTRTYKKYLGILPSEQMPK